jgi:hypothetical protein
MKIRTRIPRFAVPLLVTVLSLQPAQAQGQRSPGEGNEAAFGISRMSPMVQSAYRLLVARAQTIRDPKLREQTMDALTNPDTCIHHRASLSAADKGRILNDLIEGGLIDPRDNDAFPGGLIAGVFPPVLNEGSACPHLPQRFLSAPGDKFGGHHSYPGGLSVHEANNELLALALADRYRAMYGPVSSGFPTINLASSPAIGLAAGGRSTDALIDEDIIVAAPIWHDWAKAIVFQWNSDGSESSELNFGGNGSTDENDAMGSSKTGAHHILGIAEAMKRGMRADFVIAVASAHAAPTLGNEYKVVNWLRAAAIIAEIDAVQKGYLSRDFQGHLRLPPLRTLGDLDLPDGNPPQTNLLAEYVIHNLSDADFSYSIPAITSMQVILEKLAPNFGFDPGDASNYNNRFRNPVLSYFTAERLLIIYSQKGLAGVRSELQKLRVKKII